MIRKIVLSVGGIVAGIGVGLVLLVYTPFFPAQYNELKKFSSHIQFAHNQVIGFLPYWLLNKASRNYSPYLTTLTYFGLTLDSDGTILKKKNAAELDPGWNDLSTGKVNSFLNQAQNQGLQLSLLVFDGDSNSINSVVDDPINHARNLIADIRPIMKKYHFTNLNLDLESVHTASDDARLKFTYFIREVKKGMDKNGLGTLTLDIAPDALVKKYIIDLPSIANSIDSAVLMGYDYHYIGSFVTGPVAPLAGAGIISEFDVSQAINRMKQIMPANKIVLGVPLYGYQWETINQATRSATLPSSGISYTTSAIQKFLSKCASCSAKLDPDAFERYVVYKDQETGTYHQIFYPDQLSMKAKIEYAQKEKLGGLAVWALGYEDNSILTPLIKYKGYTIFQAL